MEWDYGLHNESGLILGPVPIGAPPIGTDMAAARRVATRGHSPASANNQYSLTRNREPNVSHHHFY